MFSRQLIEYTESTFKEEEITIRAKTKVKAVDDKYITVQIGEGEGDDAVIEKIPYGLLVWATGNAPRPVVTDLMEQIPGQEVDPRGLNVDEYLAVKGVEDIFAVGDCAISNYAPTAQVATQEGYFLARVLNSRALADDMKATLALLSEKQSEATDMDTRNKILNEIGSLQRKMRRVSQLGPFQYSHQGSLAYIGKERAVADLTWLSGNIASGGTLTYLFWRSAYLSMCFS
ncbi:NADH:ubiquinone oxidoreductase, partial [Ascosphaera acerosa]